MWTPLYSGPALQNIQTTLTPLTYKNIKDGAISRDVKWKGSKTYGKDQRMCIFPIKDALQAGSKY